MALDEIVRLVDWVDSHGFVAGTVTFPIGAYLGYRLNIWQDKRKEWNALVAPLRDALVEQRADPDLQLRSRPAVDIRQHRLDPYLRPWRRHGFAEALLRYRTAMESCKAQRQDWEGALTLSESDRFELRASIDRVLQGLKAR